MYKSITAFCLLALSAIILPASSQAQTLETGTWTGYIIPPTGERMDVSYLVTSKNDSLHIEMQSPMGNMTVSNIEVTDESMTFQWSPGVQLFCDLYLKANGGYEGECAPEGGESGMIVMNRPKKDE